MVATHMAQKQEVACTACLPAHLHAWDPGWTLLHTLSTSTGNSLCHAGTLAAAPRAHTRCHPFTFSPLYMPLPARRVTPRLRAALRCCRLPRCAYWFCPRTHCCTTRTRLPTLPPAAACTHYLLAHPTCPQLPGGHTRQHQCMTLHPWQKAWGRREEACSAVWSTHTPGLLLLDSYWSHGHTRDHHRRGQRLLPLTCLCLPALPLHLCLTVPRATLLTTGQDGRPVLFCLFVCFILFFHAILRLYPARPLLPPIPAHPPLTFVGGRNRKRRKHILRAALPTHTYCQHTQHTTRTPAAAYLHIRDVVLARVATINQTTLVFATGRRQGRVSSISHARAA